MLRKKNADFGENGPDAYYTEHPRPALVAINADLPTGLKLAREAEAEGYYRRRSPPGGRKFCYAPKDLNDLDHQAIEAIRCVIDDLQPGWVQEIKEACRLSNDPRVVAAWCEISVQVVVAVVENLRAREEIPPEAVGA